MDTEGHIKGYDGKQMLFPCVNHENVTLTCTDQVKQPEPDPHITSFLFSFLSALH